MKTLRYAIEALALFIAFTVFRLMPAHWASASGGFLGRTIGPRLAASRKAYKNLELALPDRKAEHPAIVRGMWDNLGRILAEYPHLRHIGTHRTELQGREHLEEAINSGKGIVFAGGHIGNWEVSCAFLLGQFNKKCDITYRAPNNPWTDKLIKHFRSLGGQLRSYPKSRESGRHLIKALKSGDYLGILIDQKYNEGLDVPFFGHSAMTNTIAAQLCQKLDVPLVPIRVERIGPCRFRMNIHPPTPLHEQDGSPRPIENIMQELHIQMEQWISERPEQWIWMHRRWTSRNLKTKQDKAA